MYVHCKFNKLCRLCLALKICCLLLKNSSLLTSFSYKSLFQNIKNFLSFTLFSGLQLVDHCILPTGCHMLYAMSWLVWSFQSQLTEIQLYILHHISQLILSKGKVLLFSKTPKIELEKVGCNCISVWSFLSFNMFLQFKAITKTLW